MIYDSYRNSKNGVLTIPTFIRIVLSILDVAVWSVCVNVIVFEVNANANVIPKAVIVTW